MVHHDPSVERAQRAANIETPDPEHSQHVTYLALRLFDQLEERFPLPEEGRDLLAAAALWHDCGQFRSLPDHHRYSFNRIMAVPLKNFDRDEQIIIATVARYHRAAEPSLQHPAFRRLPPESRQLVEKLAAILRLAEGLDASHQQFVRDVQVMFADNTLILEVVSRIYPSLEVEKAQARAGLFRSVFGVDVAVIPKMLNSEPNCKEAT